jgi:lipopolysaccharide heptosyltransferase II
MLTLPYAAALARLYPEVDEVIEVDTNRIRSVGGLLAISTWKGYASVLRNLRGENFDVAVSVNGRMASLWAWMSKAPRATGFEGEAYPFMLGDALTGGRYARRRHEVEYVRELAEQLGAMAPTRLNIPVPDWARKEIEERLSALGVDRSDTLMVVHGGSVNGNAKRWPASHWSRFIDSLASEARIKVILVGAEADAAVTGEVIRGTKSPIVSLVGQTDIPQLVALLARADLVATGDSGPLHLAVALDRPVLGVYGPTDPAIYGPYGAHAPTVVHRADLPCSPCYSASASADCPLGDAICMRLVSVEQMVVSAKALLASHSR